MSMIIGKAFYTVKRPNDKRKGRRSDPVIRMVVECI